MKRRDFLHDISHALAAPIIFTGIDFNSLLFETPSFLNTIEAGNILILIRLNGGNDGLNTLIPLDQSAGLNYIRPDVVLPDGSTLNIDSNDLGLHPSMPFFKSLYDEKRLKIVQSVGYPTPNYSHFRSMDIWQSASDSNIIESSGWMGRYLEKLHPQYPLEYPNENYPDPLAIELNNSSLNFTGKTNFTSIVTSSWNTGNYTQIFNPFNYEYPNSKVGEKLSYLQLIGNQANTYNKILSDSFLNTPENTIFPNNYFGSQLSVVSRLINSGLNTRIYSVELGGFDTHDFQVDQNDHTKGSHAILLKELNDGIEALMKSLDLSKKSDKVMGLIYSEFGRTVASNKTGGTDHGTSAPVFIFGNKVDPNISGVNPVIPSNADLQYETDMQFDFRQVYSSVITQWMGGSSNTAKDVLFKDFEEIQIVGKEYIDSDNDGVADINDNCPDTPGGSVVDLNGCVLFTLAANNYSVKSVSASCIGSNNGKIEVSAEDTSYTYQVNISGIDSNYSLSADNNHSLVIEDLEVGAYTINFTIDSQEGYIQSFETTITEPAPLQGKAQVDYFSKTAKLKLSGSEVYYIEVNGQMMASNSNDFSAPLKPGKNIIKVTTPLDCQGVYEEVLFMSEKLRYFPNPVQNELNITVPGTDSEINIEIFTDGGANLYRGTHSINGSRTIQLPMSRYKSGLYIVTGSGKTVNESFKIIKN
ncbi:DUF1501 domain-containing protein [Flavobacteriaceae bacterium]|nr:DUF1501 domain-containing protein [Flavobacteriaceae bacterium]